MNKIKYDLFLSYNAIDAHFVQLLASTLSDFGLRVWFDKWELVPGQAWALQLEQVITESAAIGICIGKRGVEKKSRQELDLASWVQARNQSYLIIPILLPNASPADIPLSLRAIEFADFREGLSSTPGISTLISVIRKKSNPVDPLYRESEQTKKESTNEHEMANTLLQLGSIAYRQGDFAEARRLYNESLEISKKLGNQIGIASTLHQLGMITQDQGDFAEARRLYNESLEIKHELGDQNGIAITLHNLAAVEQDQGDFAEARRLYNESLEISKKLGNQIGIASTLHNIATLARYQRKFAEARRLYNESLEISKKLGDQSGIAITFHELGTLAEDQGNLEEAAHQFREALNIFEKLRMPYAEIARESLNRVESEE
jgi:tetratricopeptide (TPR) repeat protein